MKVAEFVGTMFVGVVLLAGSCASPNVGAFADPNVNYPIEVEPQFAEANFTAPAPSAGLNPADSARFGRFVADFLDRGRGAISVSVPDSTESPEIIAFFGEKLASLGVPRTRILVGTHAAENARTVKIGYVRYLARTQNCGAWTTSRTNIADNTPAENFGCSTQHNIAAQVSDPHDLTAMQSPDPRDPARRTDAVKKYEKGSQPVESAPKISGVGN